MTVTTEEAAAILGMTEAGVRKLAERGRLTPVRAEARPLRFREDDVHAYATTRTTASDAARQVLGYPPIICHDKRSGRGAP